MDERMLSHDAANALKRWAQDAPAPIVGHMGSPNEPITQEELEDFRRSQVEFRVWMLTGDLHAIEDEATRECLLEERAEYFENLL